MSPSSSVFNLKLKNFMKHHIPGLLALGDKGKQSETEYILFGFSLFQEAGAGIDFGSTYEELDEVEKKTTCTPVNRPNFYGPIPGKFVSQWQNNV